MSKEAASEALRDSERLLQSASSRAVKTAHKCELQSLRQSVRPIPACIPDDAPTEPYHEIPSFE